MGPVLSFNYSFVVVLTCLVLKHVRNNGPIEQAQLNANAGSVTPVYVNTL